MSRLFLRRMVLTMVAVFWAIGYAAAGDPTGPAPAAYDRGLTPIVSGDSTPPSSTPHSGTRGLAKSKVTAKLKPVEEPLSPIPDPQQGAPVAIEAASFKGVVPGTSTKEDVENAWGAPKKTTKSDGDVVHLYSVDPFQHVEVHYADGKVASIVILLERSFPADAVAKQLGLGGVRAVTVSDDLGEVLGLAFPERGVMFAAASRDEPGKTPMNISRIVLEAISAEAFVLRAETTLDSRADLSRRDLEEAIQLEPANARAHWLLSRVLTAVEQPEKAEAKAAEAVRLEPSDAQYRVTHAQTLAELGRFAEATEEAKKAATDAKGRPHVHARATCLLGDLSASGAKPDFKKALGLHTQAIQLADPLASDPHPAIRVAAKEVLVDAHLSAAHDIAWGQWQDKPKAVTMWLEQAVAAADDLVNNEAVGQERLFRVYARALAAYVGLHGEVDPEPTIKAVTETGEKLIADARTAERKAEYQAELGAALYDAVQICQMRSDGKSAIRFGEAAAKHLAAASQARPSATTFLLGRLYFRLGTIHAMQDGDHKGAIVWFDKAVPLLERAASDERAADPGRFGESFVGMGVSYWEAGQRDKGVALTQKGIKWMEQAVQQGAMDRASLAVPYGNLAAMHRKLGANDQADRYQEMASRAKNEKVK